MALQSFLHEERCSLDLYLHFMVKWEPQAAWGLATHVTLASVLYLSIPWFPRDYDHSINPSFVRVK